MMTHMEESHGGSQLVSPPQPSVGAVGHHTFGFEISIDVHGVVALVAVRGWGVLAFAVAGHSAREFLRGVPVVCGRLLNLGHAGRVKLVLDIHVAHVDVPG